MTSANISSGWFAASNDRLKANFCPFCNTLLDLPDISGKIVCRRCGCTCSMHDLETKVNVTRMKKSKVHQSNSFVAQHAAKINDGSVECAKCGNKELYFKTAQLRCADEGQTVFYECTMCGYA